MIVENQEGPPMSAFGGKSRSQKSKYLPESARAMAQKAEGSSDLATAF